MRESGFQSDDERARARAARRNARTRTLLIVLTAVGGLFLMRAVLPGAIGTSSQQETTRVKLRGVRAALVAYQAQHGRLPEGLAALTGAGLLDRVPTDAWGRAFEFARAPDAVTVRSLGADGAPGGEGQHADISVEVREEKAETAERNGS